MPDDDPLGGRDQSKRDGTRLDQFVFRVTDADRPVSIAVRPSPASGFVQLRRAFPARPPWSG